MSKTIALIYFILLAFILFNAPSLEATRILPDPPAVLAQISQAQASVSNISKNTP